MERENKPVRFEGDRRGREESAPTRGLSADELLVAQRGAAPLAIVFLKVAALQPPARQAAEHLQS